MRSRITLLTVGILIAGMMTITPARAAEVEVTPFIGYTTGGEFNNEVTGKSLSLDETSSYGLMLDFKQAEDSWIELYYSRQQTRLGAGQGPFFSNPRFDVDIEYYHLGGTYGAASGRLRPFVVGTFGATHMVPQGAGLQSETKFSLSLGGGARFYLTKHVGLRFDARWFGTFFNGSGSVFCSGGACLIDAQGSVMSQFTANGGVILAF